MSWIIGLFTGGWSWLLYVAGAAVIAIGAAWGMHHWDQVAYLQLSQSIVVANEKAIIQAVSKQKSADQITAAVEMINLQKQQQVEVVTKTIIRKVPIYVTPQIDIKYPMPCGLVRLLDAAASGADPDSTPNPSSLADDATCPVTASDAARVIAENYGQYRSVATQLAGLQDWVTQEGKSLDANSAPP